MDKKMEDRFAVYVSSFDGYKDLWNVFFRIFEAYWPDCQHCIYLVNNEEKYKYRNVKVLNTGPEEDWFTRTIKSLESISEKYILFMLEDYFLSKPINENDILEVLSCMDENDIFFYRLSPSSLKMKKDRVIGIPTDTDYPISLQPAIWDREKLLAYLYEINKKSPWDFEMYFVEKYANVSGIISGVCYDGRDILGYKNGVLRGKWIPRTVRYYKRRGFDIDVSKRGMLNKSNSIKFELAFFFSRIFSRKFRSLIKKVLKIFHINYL